MDGCMASTARPAPRSGKSRPRAALWARQRSLTARSSWPLIAATCIATAARVKGARRMFTTASPTPGQFVTAAELLKLPDDGRVTELVRGRIVETPPAYYGHGRCCFAIARALSKYLDQNDC